MDPLHTERHPSGADAPPSVVMLHGNSACAAQYHPALSSWGANTSVLLVDLPGHGKSPRLPPEDYHYARVLDALEASLRPLASPFLLVGHSLGGHLAIDLMPRLPQAAGLVFCGAAPLHSPPNLAEAFHAVPHREAFFLAEPATDAIQSILQRYSAPGDHVSPLHAWFRATDPAARTAIGQDLATGATPDEVAHLRSIDRPKFMLCPDQDPVPNLDYVRALEVGIEFLPLPHCGHYPMLDQPAAFATAVAQIAASVV